MGGLNGPTSPIMIPTRLDHPMGSSSQLSSSHPSPSLNVPPPNPPFTFPARPSSSGSSFSRAMGRRPRSVVELPMQRLEMSSDPMDNGLGRSPALPNFSFNPGATTRPSDQQPGPSALPDFSFNPGVSQVLDNSLLSPPHSPMTPRTIPARQGHRRSGSEFVGGNLRTGDSITVMSTSPTRSEGFPSPTLAPVNPPPRRGHAHRRSAAISSHDLSLILKPPSPNNHRGSSAPTSPAEFDNKAGSFSEMRRDSSKSESELTTMHKTMAQQSFVVASGPPTPEIRIEPKPTARARVGFSDTLEFIPRPLSLVSTDTGSTVTARPGHSGSGSISSIASITNPTAPDREPPSVPDSPASSKKSGSRPSTAGAVLERTQTLQALEGQPQSPRRRNSIPLLINLPQDDSSSPASPSPAKTPKRWSFFGMDPFASSNSPTRSRPLSSHSTGTMSRTSDTAKSSSEQDVPPNISAPGQRPASRNPSVKKKKQRKVKLWAGSILTRTTKARSRKKATRRQCSTPTPTPPLSRARMREEINDDDEEDFHDAFETPTPTVLVTEPHSPDHSPDHSATFQPLPAQEDDASYPMIDLDAALGPFNTPSARDPQWEAAQNAGTPPKRQLHSAAGMRNFTGPGMHYHRRAESAPALAPFEPGRFGIHRFGSSSTMADVFEEDEEDEGAEASSEKSGIKTRKASADSSEDSSDYDTTPTQERDIGVPASLDTSPVSSVKRKGSGSSLDMQPPGTRVRTETSTGSFHGGLVGEDDFGPYRLRRDTNFSGISDASDSPAPSPRTLVSKSLAPVDMNSVNLPAPSMAPVSPFSTNHSSSFPSPRSPMSYDAQRISTAPSSIADENNFQSLLMGEPGPEVVRMSFEVPSLTSTNSTMTRDSVFMPPVRPRNMPFHDQRPASFTSSAFGRRRSSLAGLSRLISSAHGERSKLSVEVSCDDEPEKKSRTSKTKRFSRIMQFWKPKESKQS